MGYASQTEIEMAAGGAQRLVDLADWNSDGVADEAVIAEAIARADGLIDSYLRLRYQTPVATPSESLKRLSADEAIYWLRQRRGMASEDDNNEREVRAGVLEMMRSGKLRPDDPLPTKSTATSSVWIESDASMSRKNSRGMW